MLGFAALIGTYGCQSSRDIATLRAQSQDTGMTRQIGYTGNPVMSSYSLQAPSGFTEPLNGAGGPVLVACEGNQRALVRSAVVNGQAVSQVQCVSVAMMPAQIEYDQGPMVTYAAAPARVVPVTTTYSSPARRVVSEPVRRAPTGRTKTKSAIIIGSSAGVGAGVGAAVGGKKGALIGAAIGGGSAAIWDQITRR
jgi:hypothetical protein